VSAALTCTSSRAGDVAARASLASGHLRSDSDSVGLLAGWISWPRLERCRHVGGVDHCRAGRDRTHGRSVDRNHVAPDGADVDIEHAAGDHDDPRATDRSRDDFPAVDEFNRRRSCDRTGTWTLDRARSVAHRRAGDRSHL
jgi:hypothetical protein